MKEKLDSKNTIFNHKNNKEFLKELHPTKNLHINFNLISIKNTNHLICWVCNCCKTEWMANLYTRFSDRNSQYNKGKKCPRCDSFASKNPEKLKDWHPTKNINIDPFTIGNSTNQKFWWLCSNCGHEYFSKTTNCSCGNCNSKKVSFVEKKFYYFFTTIFGKSQVHNSFKIKGTNREIDIFIKKYKLGFEYDGYYFHLNKREFDIEKNKLCEKLDYCLIKIRDNDIIHYSKNGFLTKTFRNCLNFIKNNFKLSKKELENIEKSNNINYDIIDVPKPFLIYPLVENSIEKTHPDISKLFHYSKNKMLTTKMITFGMYHKCWWICSKCGKSFNRYVNTTIKTNCECNDCRNKNRKKIVPIGKKPEEIIPVEFLNEFIYHKNKNLIFKSKIQWWKCSCCNNEWQATVLNRIGGKQKCNNCFPQNYKKNSKNLISQNDLLLKEWVFEKNIIDPTNTTIGTNKKVFWKCSFCKNEWQTRIDSRGLKNSGCPNRCHNKAGLKN